MTDHAFANAIKGARWLGHAACWFGFLFLFHLAYVAIVHNVLLHVVDIRGPVRLMAEFTGLLAAYGLLMFGAHFILSTPLLWWAILSLRNRIAAFYISDLALVVANLLLSFCFAILFWLFASLLKGFWAMGAGPNEKMELNDLGSAANLVLESISLVPSVTLACLVIGFAKWMNRRT